MIDKAPVLDTPGKVAWRVRDLCPLRKEYVVALYLNARNRELSRETVSIGTLTASLIHPREVFSSAITQAAAGVVLVHNHPSGDPSPSPEDRQASVRVAKAGEIIGIPLIDHLIVSTGGYFSFREHGIL